MQFRVGERAKENEIIPKMALRDLFDGIDSALEFMPVQKEYGNRFRAIVQGVGFTRVLKDGGG